MRIPSVRRIANPKRLISGMLKQTTGVVIYAAANKFVPNKWVRWGVYLVASASGLWYPITQETLVVTGLSNTINETF